MKNPAARSSTYPMATGSSMRGEDRSSAIAEVGETVVAGETDLSN
jgi:hypothetical protein